ncbi:MAG: glycosyltransferase [Halieaceae bacterium]
MYHPRSIIGTVPLLSTPSDSRFFLAITPKVSVIVIAYRMAAQLQNTLYTLTADYQDGVSEDDYEVIVMENSSDDNLTAEQIDNLAANFHYTLREERAATPVFAVNEAFKKCRAPFICLMIDGARMVSPGIIKNAIMAYAISPNTILAVPGYHLGQDEQHMVEGVSDQFAYEQNLLASIDWRHNGYELFGIATFSGANRRGYLQPIMECNCLFASAANFQSIGYANTEFTLPGGGSINLHMYRSLGMLPDTTLLVTPGEGSFHQFHGGVTTSSYSEREAEIERHRVQLHSYWPGGFHSLRREPTLLGSVSPQAQPFLALSLERAEIRNRRIRNQKRVMWEDDST